MRAIEFQCISDEMAVCVVCVFVVWGGWGKKVTYLSTQMDWQAGARSEWQAISALASFKWSLYAFVALCKRCCRCPFFMQLLSFAVHFRWVFFTSPCRLSSPPSLISNKDLSKSSMLLIWRGAARIKDRNTHLLLHQLTPLTACFLSSSLFFSCVCPECPIRWKCCSQ